MKRKWVFGLLVLPVFMFLLSAADAAAPAKDKIRVGWVTSLSYTPGHCDSLRPEREIVVATAVTTCEASIRRGPPGSEGPAGPDRVPTGAR